MARKRGSNAVVNIVTSFQETPLNSKTEYTCNSGLNSGVIELGAQFAVIKASPTANAGSGSSPFASRSSKESMARFPRAFAVAPTGHCYGSWGYQPKNPERPKDPALRALEDCKRCSEVECKLYAVDDTVVYRHAGIDINDMKPIPIK